MIFFIIVALIAGMGLSGKQAVAAPTEKTIRVAHVSDMHVMIEEYCNVYSGSYQAESKVTKLLEETTTISEAVFDDIYNMDADAPMYIFITGDITSNGEYANHVWLSNLYKAFTERMRSRTDYDFSGFQIFLSPGNHDIYNCRAKSFMPADEELDACADYEERLALLSDFDSRSVPSITSKQFMDLYSDFGFCSCPNRKNGQHLATCGMVDGCSIEYFFESNYWYDSTTSRDGTGLEVRTPSESVIKAFEESDHDYNIYNPDARFGACSYIARMDGFDVLTLDSNTRAYKYPDWQTSDPSGAIYSCSGWHESTGGMVSEDQLRWALSSLKADIANNKVVFTLGHANFLPHFDSEDEVISLFSYDNWEQASYTLADAGIRYAFSGHQHASDIATYVTQKGNVFYDVETGSLASYGCSWRTMDLIISTDAAGNYTEDFRSLTHSLNYSPFVYGVYKLTEEVTDPLVECPVTLFRGYESSLMPANDLTGYRSLQRSITVDNITNEELGIADYLAAQMYNMASSLEHGIAGEYVGQNIFKLLKGLTEKLDFPFLKAVADAIVDDLDTIDLLPISFSGNTYQLGTTPLAGYNLGDFTEDLAEFLMQYDFSGSQRKNLTLAKAFLVIYGGHLAGAHTSVLDSEIAPLIEMLKDGRFVRGVVNLLEELLLPQLEVLLDTPIRFDESTAPLSQAGFDITDALHTTAAGIKSGFPKMIDAIVKILMQNRIILHNTDEHGYSSLRLILSDINGVLSDLLITDINHIEDDTVSFVANAIRPVLSSFSFAKYIDMAQEYLGQITGGETLRSIIDSELVNKYVTDAFCKNLGTYGANILIDLNVDQTEDGSAWIEGGDRYTRYPVRYYKHTLTIKDDSGTTAYNGHTYYRDASGNDKLTVTPSAENGLLANMISVSFNEDIYTEKKIVWFTAEQVDVFSKDARGQYAYSLPDSYIRYSTNKDMSDAVTVRANGENVNQVMPTIDLGIIFINLNHAYKNYNRYTVTLTGLAQGTTYYYQVGKDGAWTETFRFATASDGTFTFMAISDIQGSVEENYVESKFFMEKAFTTGEVAFVMSAGDNVDNGENILQYTWLLNDHQVVYANNTFVTTAGNHEKKANALDSVIALPDDASVTGETGYYYSYDYNYAHFVILNTNDLDENGNLNSAQTRWLKNDLAKNQENAATTWTIVLLHKGPYTAGSHAFDDDVVALRAQLTPIFNEYGVDLVLQGHDHTYSVSEFIGGDGKKATSFKNGKIYDPEGVLYLNLGTMGDKFYDYIYSDAVDLADRESAPEGLEKYFTADNNLELTETPVFARITVSKNELTIMTYTILNGEIIPVDNVTLAHEESIDADSSSLAGYILFGSIILAALVIATLCVIPIVRGKRKV